LPPLVRSARKLHRFGHGVVRAVSKAPLSYTMLRRLRMVSEGLSRDRFYEMISDFREVDLDVYFNLLAHLHEHDAERELSTIAVPTLVMAGSRDLLTPPWLARHIARTVPGAELFIISGGTHYSAAEYPDRVAARFETFVNERPSLA
jgi:pimeloyl-ACP methyl ester carboxylesterase